MTRSVAPAEASELIGFALRHYHSSRATLVSTLNNTLQVAPEHFVEFGESDLETLILDDTHVAFAVRLVAARVYIERSLQRMVSSPEKAKCGGMHRLIAAGVLEDLEFGSPNCQAMAVHSAREIVVRRLWSIREGGSGDLPTLTQGGGTA